MSEIGWASFLGEHHQEESPAARASRLAWQQAERDDRRELAAETGHAAALEDERERRAVAYHQLGIAGRSAGQVFADASAVGDEDGEYEAARATMERIDRRRARRAEAARFAAGQVTLAQRSASPGRDLLREPKRIMAEVMAQPARPERRPFASRSRGAVAGAVRSEMCQHCIDQGASDQEAFLLHSDPEYGLPVTPPGQAVQAGQDERAEYRSGQGGRVPMICR